MQELEKARKLLSQDHKITSNELKELMGELEKSSKEVKKLESEVTAKVTRLSELEGAAASDSEAVSNRRDNLEKLRKDAGGLEMQRHRLEGEKEQLELQLTNAREQVSRSGQWLESIVTDVKEADFQLEDLQVGRESTAKNLGKIKTKHKTVLETIESHQKRLTGIESQLRDESMKLASQEAAQRAREEFGGYAKGVKAVLQCRDEGKLKGIIGTIAELGRVDEEYATALEVAAGARLQSIVTENDMAAAEAIQFLKRNNIGRVRFLPLNKIHTYKPSAHALLIAKKDGAIGFAQDLVKFDSRYKDAFGNVFGDTVQHSFLALQYKNQSLHQSQLNDYPTKLFQANQLLVKKHHICQSHACIPNPEYIVQSPRIPCSRVGCNFQGQVNANVVPLP